MPKLTALDTLSAARGSSTQFLQLVKSLSEEENSDVFSYVDAQGNNLIALAARYQGQRFRVLLSRINLNSFSSALLVRNAQGNMAFSFVAQYQSAENFCLTVRSMTPTDLTAALSHATQNKWNGWMTVIRFQGANFREILDHVEPRELARVLLVSFENGNPFEYIIQYVPSHQFLFFIERMPDSVLLNGLCQLSSSIGYLKKYQSGQVAEQLLEKIKPGGLEQFARNIRQVITPTLMWSYLDSLIDECKRASQNSVNNQIGLVALEKNNVYARMRWSEVVTETFLHNQATEQHQNITEKVLQRINSLHLREMPEAIYHRCLYILQNAPIIVTFSAGSLSGAGLTSYQLMNGWEKEGKFSPSYQNSRLLTEKGLFNFLPARVKKEFKNVALRPRYGALGLPLRGDYLRPTANYGSSFIVFKPIVKQNALFSPGDSLNHYSSTGKHYQLCTIHHLNFVLWQCPIPTLLALAGYPPSNFSWNNWYESLGGYIEVLLPALNVFDPNLVEHIHIDFTSYWMDSNLLRNLEKSGIPITNACGGPYEDASRQWWRAVEHEDVPKLESLAKQFPSLLALTNKSRCHIGELAVGHGSFSMLKFLEKQKVAIEPRGALLIAMLNNQLAMAKYIFAKAQSLSGKSLSLLVNELGQDCLAIVSQKNFGSLVNYLIVSGDDVNRQDAQGWTPLHWAVYYQNEKLVNALLNHGATLLINNHAGQTAFDIDRKEVAKFKNLLVEKSQLLIAAIRDKNRVCIEAFFHQNPNWLNIIVDKQGEFALHMAVRTKDLDFVIWLVEICGVDLNPKILNGGFLRRGASPLFLALTEADIPEAILAYLIRRGANLDGVDGITPLMGAQLLHLTARQEFLKKTLRGTRSIDASQWWEALRRAIDENRCDLVNKIVALPSWDSSAPEFMQYVRLAVERKSAMLVYLLLRHQFQQKASHDSYSEKVCTEDRFYQVLACLDIARKNTQPMVLKILVKYGLALWAQEKHARLFQAAQNQGVVLAILNYLAKDFLKIVEGNILEKTKARRVFYGLLRHYAQKLVVGQLESEWTNILNAGVPPIPYMSALRALQVCLRQAKSEPKPKTVGLLTLYLLNIYIHEKKQLPSDTYRTKLFGIPVGYSACQKLGAAQAWLDFLNGNIPYPLLAKHEGALRNGRLGQLYGNVSHFLRSPERMKAKHSGQSNRNTLIECGIRYLGLKKSLFS